MPRYFLTLEYQGGPFCGWQHQARGLAVQDVVEAAAARLAGTNGGQPVSAYCAGRTDAGVHALGQVAHVDFAKAYDEATVASALNAHLRPHPVAVVAARRVADAAHARFDATGRAYRYRIRNRPAPLTWEEGLAWHVRAPLALDAMQAAADNLLGHHDFTSFRATECQGRSPEKTLDRLEVQRTGDLVEVVAQSRSFLHHQVRNMVGTLVLVGKGAAEPAWITTVLAARDRRAAGPTAPAAGLYLERVDYADLVRRS